VQKAKHYPSASLTTCTLQLWAYALTLAQQSRASALCTFQRGYLQKAPAAHLKSPFEEKEQQIRTTGDVLEEQTDLPAHLLHDISPSHKNFNEHLLTHNLYIPKAERSQVSVLS